MRASYLNFFKKTSEAFVGNANRTEWSPIRPVIIRVITICLSRVWLQTELDDMKSYYQLIIKITIFEKRRIPRYEKGKFALKVFTLFQWWLKPRLWLVDLKYVRVHMEKVELRYWLEHSEEKNMNKLVEWKAFVDTYGIKSPDLKNKLLFKSFAAFRATSM